MNKEERELVERVRYYHTQKKVNDPMWSHTDHQLLVLIDRLARVEEAAAKLTEFIYSPNKPHIGSPQWVNGLLNNSDPLRAALGDHK